MQNVFFHQMERILNISNQEREHACCFFLIARALKRNEIQY